MSSIEVKDFLDNVRGAESSLNMAIADKEDMDRQTQDILHAVEFQENDPNRTRALVRTLRDIRRKRRVAKDTIELLTPVVEWADDNQDALKSLERLLGSLRKAERAQQSRLYAHRTDILESSGLLIKEQSAGM